jgi:hypothetical protein
VFAVRPVLNGAPHMPIKTPAYVRVGVEIVVAISLVVGVIAVVLAIAIATAHAAPEPQAWQLGCKIRTGLGLTAIVIGTAWVAAFFGFVTAALFHVGGRS